MPSLRIAAYSLLLASSAVLGAQNSTLKKVLVVRAPIALTAAGSTTYFVATDDGTVLEYKNDNGTLHYDRQCTLPAFYHPTDITGSQDTKGSPLAFVVAWSSVTHRGMIARCAESGSSMTVLTTLIDDIPASISYSPGNSSLYYLRATRGELHEIGFDLKDDRFVAELSSVQRPGAMGVSGDAKYLFVADMNDQRIVQFDLQKPGKANVVVNAIGYPSAIFCDASTDILYAADFSGRQVIRVNLQGRTNRRLDPIRSSDFKGIEGLAPGPAGGLLIADNKANAVFLCVGAESSK